MTYEEAARALDSLLAEATAHSEANAPALEAAGAVHTEALLASLEAFNQAKRIALATGAGNTPQKLTAGGAALQPMPERTAQLRLEFPLTPAQLETLQTNPAPADEFNRWFLSCEGNHLRYYRNATGYCFFDAVVEPAGDGFVVGEVTVNQDDKQYSEDQLGVCAAQLKILLANNLGLDDEPYWDEMDAASDN